MFICILYFALILGASAGLDGPEVTIPLGRIKGSWRNSIKGGRSYASFEGVPYGMPTDGEYRFKPARPVKNWTGVLVATRPGQECLQYNGWFKQVSGSEACLSLNIYTPKLPSPGTHNQSLPVIVYIHGGAFLYGAGAMYNPARFMDRDVVFVTINYRLGPLGFLSTEDQASPGNYGLKDQAEALRWVRSNIGYFGGDPENINLAGHSAGGASVHFHCLANPAYRVPFKRSMPLSGSAFNPWALMKQPVINARRLAGSLNCFSFNSTVMVECLRWKSGYEIANAQRNMYEWSTHLFSYFTPVVEPSDTEDAFLTEDPVTASRNGKLASVPMFAGVVSDEGLYPAAMYQRNASNLAVLDTMWDSLAGLIFHFDTLPLDLQHETAQRIKQFYFEGQPVSQKTFPDLVHALSNSLFDVGVGEMVQEHALRTGQPAYLYRYSFRGEYSLTNLLALDNKNYGTSHGDEVIHLFYMPDFDYKWPSDIKMIDLLQNLIVTYATTGVPELPEGNLWQPQNPLSPQLSYLEISSPDHVLMETSSDFGNRTFWEEIYRSK